MKMEGYVYLHTLLGLFLMLIVLGCIYYIRIRHQRKIFLQILQLRRIIAAQESENPESGRDHDRILVSEACQVEYPASAYPPTYEEVQNAKTYEDKPPPYEEVCSGNFLSTTIANETQQR